MIHNFEDLTTSATTISHPNKFDQAVNLPVTTSTKSDSNQPSKANDSDCNSVYV